MAVCHLYKRHGHDDNCFAQAQNYKEMQIRTGDFLVKSPGLIHSAKQLRKKIRKSVESQKGAITIQSCSVESQKGAITIQSCSV